MHIAGAECAVRRFPLHDTWDGGVFSHDCVVVTVTADTGDQGTGFGWTPRVGGEAVRAVVEHDCAPLLHGRDPAPAPRWEDLYAHLHEAGPGGISAMALAAVDIALWDLRARSLGLSLVDLIGRRRDSAPCYGSGVNLDRDLDELLEQVRRFTAAGHTAVKMKVGSADLERDTERVARVRELLGPGGRLMIDANQRWNLPRAIDAMRALSRFDPYWIEEPLPADDLHAHARLRATTTVPFAVGENLRTVRAFRDALVGGVCDVAQPNVVRVGGITAFLRIADLAAAFSVPVAPHLLPDLSAQLAQCVPAVAMVEDIEQASFADLGALERPSGVSVGAAGATSDTPPGHGLAFAEPAR
ncbi:mandelate racemase/muconate lactonizing enzyme family protein [Streptomonospora salina]|uniref:L-alanine-DL-glutamate epimerase-like enolase superfamily enzyme n=1 Tax=Streptomonospora salina TaxID=104205 RepID=A0A841E716_9ACTN|nr:mandelate racemase/muconate lactonizing enzyme family protein [Streptomonospora salina]MBB5998632.1 L-alanine-DL-glutamate epimerase-like enolase superfamily enzyme [Streptomonospora salina]